MLQVCIWDYYGHRKHALMNDMDKTLDDANIQTDQDVGFFTVQTHYLFIYFNYLETQSQELA